MTTFTIYNETNAPEATRDHLSGIKKDWGFIPNLHGILADSPVALEAYDSLFGLVAKSTLSPAEQQVVYQTFNVFHGCEYCVSGHTMLARKAGVPEQAVQALRNRVEIVDERLQALRKFAETVVETRGFAKQSAIDTFIGAGYTKANILEVVTILATKVISNYTNHLTGTPLDDFMKKDDLQWSDPEGRSANKAPAVSA